MPFKLVFTGLLCFCFCSAIYAQRTLSEYIQTAKERSPLINDNKNQSIANRAEAERLKAMFTKPQVGITANYLLAPIYTTDGNKNRFEINPKNNAVNYYGYDLGASNGGTYQALLTLTQPLFNSQVSETLSGQALVSAQINDNAVKLNAHDLEKMVTDQYILSLQDRKQADYAAGILRLLSQQASIVKKLVDASIMKSSDLTLLNIEYENNMALLITYQANYQRDLLDLNILSGIKDTTLISLDSISLSLKSDVNTSAYLDKYQLDSLSLVAGQKAFETKYKPQLRFFANTGLNAVYLPAVFNRFGVSAGLSLTWNIFDGKQKELNQSRTNALLQSVSYYKENFQTQNSVRKNKILTELNSYDARLKNAESQLRSYDNLISAFKKQIIQGQLSVIDFVNVLKNRSAVARDYLLLETNRQLLINAYNYWNW